MPKTDLSIRSMQADSICFSGYSHVRLLLSVLMELAEQLKRKCRMLCESVEGHGCNAQLEPCMGTNRERHADRLQRMTLEAKSGGSVTQVNSNLWNSK